MTGPAGGDGWWQAPDGTWHQPFDSRADARLSPSPGTSAAAEAERLAALAAEHADAAARWAQGAEGERRTAERLAALGPDFVVLHDLHVPGSDANVDHLVIGRSGVFVVDSKAYTGEFTERAGTLWSGRQPIRREVDTVEFIGARVAEFLETSVSTVLCFTHAPLPQPVIQLGATTAVSLDQVDQLIRHRPLALSEADVQRIGRRATTLAIPVDRPPTRTPDLGSRDATRLLPPPPPGPRRAAPASGPPRRRRPSLAGAVTRLAVSVVVLVVVLPAIVRGIARGGTGITLPTSTSQPTPIGPAVTLTFACPLPGTGYTGSFTWPAGQPMTLAAIDVASGPTQLVRVYWSDRAKPPTPLVGIRPATALVIRSRDVARPFTRLSTVTATAPSSPC